MDAPAGESKEWVRSGSCGQPFDKGQAGYYADVHTGLYYCHNRYYDPRLGRWLSRDPIGLEGGVNLYAYCGGNPIMFWDPSGLQVGPPTGLNGFEDCIPVWGPGRDAINEFQTGQYGWGIFHTIVAMSDIFLVKSAVVGIAKATSKVGVRAGARTLSQSGFKKGGRQILNKAGIWKSGSNTWGATRKWALQTGFAEPYVPLHHWFFAQNSYLGRLVPNVIKNQPWNLMQVRPHLEFGPNVVHQALHGSRRHLRFGPVEKLVYGTPDWAKAFGISFGGRITP